jgi:menaquinone-dependent protoporphyrinogen oxidase
MTLESRRLGLTFLCASLFACSTTVASNKQPDIAHCSPSAEATVLVTYATRYGSTKGVADAISEELCRSGMSVATASVEDVNDLTKYKAVVIGSGIRMGRWLSEAQDFVKTNAAELKRKRVAFFVVCMTLHEDSPKNRETARQYSDQERRLLNPAAEAAFAGAAEYSRLSLFHKVVGKLAGMPNGDFRDWNAIRAWAKSLPPLLADIGSNSPNGH